MFPIATPPNVILRESEMFDFIARSREPVHPNTTDTYFSYNKQGSVITRCFVKGPYGLTKLAYLPCIINCIKRTCCPSLPIIETQIIWMIPDLLPPGQMGIRAFKDSIKELSRPQPFLVYRDLTACDAQFLPLKPVTSPQWHPNTGCVVDWKSVSQQHGIGTAKVTRVINDTNAMHVFVLQLLFRCFIGCGDIRRNDFFYLKKQNTVVSLDEEMIGFNFEFHTFWESRNPGEAEVFRSLVGTHLMRYWNSVFAPELGRWQTAFLSLLTSPKNHFENLFPIDENIWTMKEVHYIHRFLRDRIPMLERLDILLEWIGKSRTVGLRLSPAPKLNQRPDAPFQPSQKSAFFPYQRRGKKEEDPKLLKCK